MSANVEPVSVRKVVRGQLLHEPLQCFRLSSIFHNSPPLRATHGGSQRRGKSICPLESNPSLKALLAFQVEPLARLVSSATAFENAGKNHMPSFSQPWWPRPALRRQNYI